MTKLRLYVAIALVAVVLALISFLLVPSGSGVSKCSRLVFESSKYTCMTGIAVSQMNASVCGYEQGSYEDLCYAQVAESANSVGTCKRVQNESTRDSCLAAVAVATGNYSSCSLASEPTASSCAESVGLSLNNLSICSSIPNLTDAATCKSIVSTRRAELTGNPDYCANVTESSDKNVTVFIVSTLNANLALGAGSQNTLLPGALLFVPNVTYTARDYCYSQLAQQLSNPGLCSNVSAGEATSFCKLQASSTATTSNSTANYTQLLAACAQLGSYSRACTQSATITQAISTRNATLCGELQGALNLACYTALASKYMNASYCNYIYNATEHSVCVGEA